MYLAKEIPRILLLLAKNGVLKILHKMKIQRIQRISEFQTEIQFPIFQKNYSAYQSSFQESKLGKIYNAIPWDQMVKSLGLKDHIKGPQSIFSPVGKLALMFLKHYALCSDEKLIEQLNANIHYQMFCDIVIPPGKSLKNYKIVSEIRCDIARRLDINKLQKILANHWKAYLSNKDSVVFDATCYESYLRFPTDVKLLYETVSWNHRQLKKLSKLSSKRTPRTKLKKWKGKYSSYSKKRRPSQKDRNSITRGLLKLLKKIDACIDEIIIEPDYKLVPKYRQKRATTKKILSQQWSKFFDGEKIKDRIVSLDRPYIRPIVRGKEIKKVEFGAKVNKLQIDGISFIEHLSFDAFNEGIRLQSGVDEARRLMNKEVKIIGADAIYANNANRTYVTKHNIKTDFKRKGRAGKHKEHYSQLAQMITKQRASALEGSFGTEKEHFLLNRIKARTELTEKLWIFLGIHTSNALKIGTRMAQKLKQVA